MKIEKSIDKKSLKTFIQKEYGLNVKKFNFVPKGEVAYSYILLCEEGKYFLKIYPGNSRLYDISHLNINLELTSLLRERYGIKNITFPIKSKKEEFRTTFKGLELIIFNFIDGADLAERDFTVLETGKLARLMARIHQIRPDGKMLKKFEQEDFSIDYVEEGLKDLFVSTNNNELRNAAQLKLKKHLKLKKKMLFAALAQLRKFRQTAKKEKLNFVITHGDPIASNIMVDKRKNLHLIDWESAKLAPPERDIWFYIEHPVGNFLKEYGRAGGKNSFNRNIISFYVYNRVLGDLIHWGQRIFDPKTSLAQASADLEGILADCDLQALRKALSPKNKREHNNGNRMH